MVELLFCCSVFFFLHDIFLNFAVKNLPTNAGDAGDMDSIPGWSLGQEDPLEEEITAHSCILAWEISVTEEPGGIVHGVAKSGRHNWVTEAHMHIRYIQI